MSALWMEDVSHRYERIQALDGVNLSVGAGEIVCLLGPSGCGKSTLLRLAAGLETLQSGRISIRGRRVADPESGVQVQPDERGVGMVFQDYALFPHLTVSANVEFGLHDAPAAERRDRAQRALEQVGMRAYSAEYPHTLSGGQQQRVSLARAMAPAPSLILLDEPFSGLDARLRHRLAADTWRLLKDKGTATLVVTHDPEEAMFLADRIAVMRDGRLIQTDTPDTIFSRPNSPFVARFFSDVNRFTGVVDQKRRIVTPWAEIGSNGLEPGTEAEVLIRYDAVRLVPAGDSSAGTVRFSRLLGFHGLVELEQCGHDGGISRIFARVHWNRMPKSGERVGVEIDPRQTFVFPSGTAK